MSGLFLNLGLIVWVGILIPSLSQVSLGFDAFGAPNTAVPAVQLILLPLISMTMFFGGILSGLYFYRWNPQRPLAFIVWISSAVSAALFLMAVLFIVSSPA